MQDADVILAILSQKSKENENYIFERLYRILFNKDIYVYSLNKLYLNENKTIIKTYYQNQDNLIHNIIDRIKVERYFTNKSNSNNTITFEDEILLTALFNIIESIYEPIFLDNSHAFRPNRNHKTALNYIRLQYKCMDTFFKGNIEISPMKDNVEVLMNLLAKKIQDERFVFLVKQFFFNGCFDNTNSKKNIISKLYNVFINIYLHEFDKYIMKYIYDNFKYINFKYVRYGNEFLIGFNKNKCIKNDTFKLIKCIENFINEELKLFINTNNMNTTSFEDNNISFLGYDICNDKKNNSSYCGETLKLLLPKKVINGKIKPFMRNGKSIHIPSRINLTIAEIINSYNHEIKELYDYYSIAVDVNSKIRDFKYYHYQSLLKTIACKEKVSVKSVIDKYGMDIRFNGKNKRVIGVEYKNCSGEKNIIYYGSSTSDN